MPDPAAFFPDAVIERRDHNDILDSSEEYDWTEVVVPDLQRRKKTFFDDSFLDKDELRMQRELECQLLETMTIYDARAPSDERFKDSVVQVMVTEMEEEVVLLGPVDIVFYPDA